MTVDDLLAALSVELGVGAVPLHAIVIVEYLDPSSYDGVTRPRLMTLTDDDLSPWSRLGILSWAANDSLGMSVDLDEPDT